MRFLIAFDHGNPYYTDTVLDGQFWLSDGKPYDYKNPRPCARCGREVAFNAPDPCIGNIPLVNSACCGHGVEDPMVFNGSITSEAQGMYNWYKFIGNQDGGFGRGFQIKDATKYDALYRLYDNTFISKYPMLVSPLGVYLGPELSDDCYLSVLSGEIHDLNEKIRLTLRYSKADTIKVSTPTREDMIAAYRASERDGGYFLPCWTKTYLHNIPLYAHQYTFDYAVPMEELNVYPLFTTTDLSLIGAVNQFILENRLHDDRIIHDDD